MNQLKIYTDTKFTQTELGVALGKTRSDINSKIKRKSELKLSEVIQIEKYVLEKYNKKIDLINAKQACDCEFYNIPVQDNYKNVIKCGVRYSDCNVAGYKISNDLAEDINLNPKKACIVFAKGDSMHPTIEDGDSVLVDIEKKEVFDGKIYCIKIDNQICIKRLQWIFPDKIKVISDNIEKYDSFYIDSCDNDCFKFQIIGQVCWWARLAR